MQGCYGLGLEGVPEAAPLLRAVSPAAPRLTVRVSGPAVYVDAEKVAPDSAIFRLQGGGAAFIDRAAGTSLLRMDDADAVPHEHLVHPFLSTSVAVMSRWHGRDAFHAGAFVTDRGAWVVLGDKGQGKSSLLALLALRGAEVLSDDLVVLDAGQVHRGPRCIDLRADAAEQLSCGEDLGVVGARHRARLRLDEAPDRVPLAGWVALEWGNDISVDRVTVEGRLPALLGNLALRLPPTSYLRMMGYAAMPFLRLTRPRQWSIANASLDVLSRAIRDVELTQS